MTDSSLTDIGLIFMVNILLISNYFFVRALRKTVDRAALRPDNIDHWRRSDLLIYLRERFASSRLVVGFSHQSSATTVPASNSAETKDEHNRACTLACFQNTAFAFVFGRHILQPSVQKTFPGWKPIPYKLGILSTSCALLLTTVLLSTEIVQDRISITPIKTEKKSDGFCKGDEFYDKIGTFQETMSNITNYENATLQRNETSLFVNALLKDTSDYGTENDSGCRDKKAKYNTARNDTLLGPFFPAYCPKALELSLGAANVPCTWKERECTDFFSCMKMENAIVCPPHSNDDYAVNTTNYRLKQFKKLAKKKTAAKTMNEFDQGDDYDMKLSSDIVESILQRIDIAGTLYSLYICVGLFFPSPLRLFRPSMIVRTKQILFGVDKKTFIILVLISWWFYQYIEIIRISYHEHSRFARNYVINLIKDPCFLDTSFIKERIEIWNNFCGDLTEFESEWDLAQVQISHIKQEIEAFDTCGCRFSGNELSKRFVRMDQSISYDELGFDYTTWNVTRDEDLSLWSPNELASFLGNTTICENIEEAKGHILVTEESEVNFWEAWITTALLANLLVKIAITNFCVALLNLADPFVTCGGTYESPPTTSMSDQDIDDASDGAFTISEEIKKDKARALRAIAIRQSLFWGLITNACLLNLLLVAVSNVGDFNPTDYIVFASLIIISFSVPCCCFFLSHCMRRAIPEDSHYETVDVESGLRFPISTPPRNIGHISTPPTRPTPGSNGSCTPPQSPSPIHLDHKERTHRWDQDTKRKVDEGAVLNVGNNDENTCAGEGSDVSKKLFIHSYPKRKERSKQDSDSSRTPQQYPPTNPFDPCYEEQSDGWESDNLEEGNVLVDGNDSVNQSSGMKENDTTADDEWGSDNLEEGIGLIGGKDSVEKSSGMKENDTTVYDGWESDNSEEEVALIDGNDSVDQLSGMNATTDDSHMKTDDETHSKAHRHPVRPKINSTEDKKDQFIIKENEKETTIDRENNENSAKERDDPDWVDFASVDFLSLSSQEEDDENLSYQGEESSFPDDEKHDLSGDGDNILNTMSTEKYHIDEDESCGPYEDNDELSYGSGDDFLNVKSPEKDHIDED